MKRTLQIAIEAGEKTCATEPGQFCPWMRVTRFGTRFVCGLFNGRELWDETGEMSGGGWLQRLPECKDAEGRG